MRETIDIEKLLERFHQGVTSPEENMQLLKLLSKNSDELDKLAQTIWEQNTQEEESLDKTIVLEALHRKLNFETDQLQAPAFNRIKVFRLVFRYAAIFIVGFGLAWLFFAKNPIDSKSSKAADFYKVTVAYGSKSTIELPDGSTVTLNSGSSLRYPGIFAADNRTVILDGEAFFDVTKNPSKPFFVKTKDITVKVLGTSFNVKSYPDDNLTETTLVTGKVEITRNSETSGTVNPEKTLVLAPNQKAVFYRESDELAISTAKPVVESIEKEEPIPLKVLVQKEVKTENVISWKNNILVFNSEPFGDIVKKLERWYNVEVTLKYTKLSPVVFSGKFDKESVQEVLHALSLIEPFRYEINKNQILIFK